MRSSPFKVQQPAGPCVISAGGWTRVNHHFCSRSFGVKIIMQKGAPFYHHPKKVAEIRLTNFTLVWSYLCHGGARTPKEKQKKHPKSKPATRKEHDGFWWCFFCSVESIFDKQCIGQTWHLLQFPELTIEKIFQHHHYHNNYKTILIWNSSTKNPTTKGDQ